MPRRFPAARQGTAAAPSASGRPVVAATEEATWDRARHLLDGLTGELGWARQEGVRAPVDKAGAVAIDKLAASAVPALQPGLSDETWSIGGTFSPASSRGEPPRDAEGAPAYIITA